MRETRSFSPPPSPPPGTHSPVEKRQRFHYWNFQIQMIKTMLGCDLTVEELSRVKYCIPLYTALYPPNSPRWAPCAEMAKHLSQPL